MPDDVPQYNVKIRPANSDDYLFEGWLPSIPVLEDVWFGYRVVARHWSDDWTVCTLIVVAA